MFYNVHAQFMYEYIYYNIRKCHIVAYTLCTSSKACNSEHIQGALEVTF